MENENIELNLTVAEVNVVLAALGEMPFKLVGIVIDRIKSQGDPQVVALQAPAADPVIDELA